LFDSFYLEGLSSRSWRVGAEAGAEAEAAVGDCSRGRCRFVCLIVWFPPFEWRWSPLAGKIVRLSRGGGDIFHGNKLAD